MRKFGTYPIVVNYNLHMQLRSKNTEDNFYRAGQREEERKLSIKTATTSDLTIKNYVFQQELNEYEQAVCNCLRKIEGNLVGRMVLGLINKNTTVWILPETEVMKKCSCAQTGPLNYEIQQGSVARGVGSGDTVISFTPELGDDTLFHELVHAYRYSFKKFDPMLIDLRGDGVTQQQSTEEFLAHQMENIYMSQANRPLTLDYKWQSVSKKEEIYDFLLDNIDALETLKYFLRHEYLAMLAAHTFTTTDYNPFRDFGTLEEKFLKDGWSPTLPELGAQAK